MQAHARMPQEPWHYGERVLDLYRAYVLLHEQLVPYVRAAAATAARTGLPIIRPLCLIDPADPRGWSITDAYGYGPALWVAPVLDDGAREREVALPRGDWIETWSGAARARRRRGRRRAPLERIPVWVRAGSIVVTYPAEHVARGLGDVPGVRAAAGGDAVGRAAAGPGRRPARRRDPGARGATGSGRSRPRPDAARSRFGRSRADDGSAGRRVLRSDPIRSCSRRSGAGAHQFHLPSSSISEGTSRARMIDASISTASAAPRPSSLMNTSLEVANAPIATANRSAAAVTIRPVRSRPIATASESERRRRAPP